MIKINYKIIGFSFFLSLFCFSLTGCATKPVALKDNEKHETPFLKPAQQSAGSDETAVNTLRIFERLTDCGDMDENGHIFYLHRIDGSPDSIVHASRFDLYVMNGNGCFSKKVMEFVSGSPAWSNDWKQLAIGCDNNTNLCILDVDQVLDRCFYDNKAGCSPENFVSVKYALPQIMAGENYLSNLSWSPDGKKILLEAENINSEFYKFFNTCILSFETENQYQWIPFYSSYGAYYFTWSPNDDGLIASSGIYITQYKEEDQVEGSNLDNIPEYPYQENSDNKLSSTGLGPAWSPDGKTIAFARFSGDETKEATGIGKINLQDRSLSWFYEPVAWDKLHWNSNIICLVCGDNPHRILSWSPHGNYIAFVSSLQHRYDIQILRLDITTGEIVVLTSDNKQERFYYAPAWGP